MRNIRHSLAGCLTTFMLTGAHAGVITEGTHLVVPPEEFRIMTPAEEAEHRARMAELTGEARESYRNQQYEMLRARARVQGYELLEVPPWGRDKVLPPVALADSSQTGSAGMTADIDADGQSPAKQADDEKGSMVKRGLDTLKDKLGFGAKEELSTIETSATARSTNEKTNEAVASDGQAAPANATPKTAAQMSQNQAEYRAAMQQRQKSYLKERGLEMPAKPAAEIATETKTPLTVTPETTVSATQRKPDLQSEAQMKQRQEDYRTRMQDRQESYLSQQGSGATASTSESTPEKPAALAVENDNDLVGTPETAAASTNEQPPGPPVQLGQKRSAASAAMDAATALAIQQTHFYGKEPDETDESAKFDEPNPLTLEQMKQNLTEQRERERANFERHLEQRLQFARSAAQASGKTDETIAREEAQMRERMNAFLARMEARHERFLEDMKQTAAEKRETAADQSVGSMTTPENAGTSAVGSSSARQTSRAQRMAEHRRKMQERFEHYMSQRSAPQAPPAPPKIGIRPGTDSEITDESLAMPNAEERSKIMQERIDTAIDSVGQRPPLRGYYPPVPPGYGAPSHGYAPPYPNPYQAPFRYAE